MPARITPRQRELLTACPLEVATATPLSRTACTACRFGLVSMRTAGDHVPLRWRIEITEAGKAALKTGYRSAPRVSEREEGPATGLSGDRQSQTGGGRRRNPHGGRTR